MYRLKLSFSPPCHSPFLYRLSSLLLPPHRLLSLYFHSDHQPIHLHRDILKLSLHLASSLSVSLDDSISSSFSSVSSIDVSSSDVLSSLFVVSLSGCFDLDLLGLSASDVSLLSPSYKKSTGKALATSSDISICSI